MGRGWVGRERWRKGREEGGKREVYGDEVTGGERKRWIEREAENRERCTERMGERGGRMERWRTAGSDLEEKENVFQMKSNEPIKE